MSITPARLHARLFEDLTPDDDLAYFARGFREDLVTELARFPEVQVLAPPGTDGSAAGPDGDGMRANLELAGSILRAEGRVRINARLVERESGATLWAERFDVALGDPFEVQREIAGAVAGTLAVSLDSLRLERARNAPVTSLAAYDLWLRGRACLEQGTTEADLEARSLFERALALDPHFSRACAGISLTYYNDWSCQSWHLWPEGEAQACRFAEQALALDDSDAFVHIVLARMHLHRGEFERAEQSVARALTLNPNHAEVVVQAALWTAFLGDGPRALTLARRAMELDPRHRDWFHAPALYAHFFMGDFAAAMRSGARAGRALVDLPAVTAAAAALRGEEAEARRSLAHFHEEFRAKILFGREPEPGEALQWLLQVNPLRRAEDRERLRTGLLRAGLSEAGARPALEPRSADLPAPGNVFRREGDLWRLAFAGKGARLVDVKGFHDLARLLAEPGRPIHCLELSRAPAEGRAGEVLDAAARRDVERRLGALAEELDEALERCDAERQERVQGEIDALSTALAQALGLGGRSRKLGDPVERARTATTWRIRSAIKRVAAAHPRLGQHLTNSIRTGLVCVYRPEQPMAWEL